MNVIFLIIILIFSAATYGNQEHSYDWQSSTYQTYLSELEEKAELVAFTEYSSIYDNAVVVGLSLKVGGKPLEFPQSILEQYEPIHPDSFRISAGDFSHEGKPRRWVTVHFGYGRYPNIHKGSISFLNNSYKAHLIHNE